MGTRRFPSQAHVRPYATGRAVIQSRTQDVGTGIATILTQLVWGVVGLEPGLVSCEIGDTELPEAGPTFGSSSTMGVGAAVMAAAHDVPAQLREHSAQELSEAPGAGGLSAAMSSTGIEELVGVGSFSPEDSPYAINMFGAIFVEIGFDPDLGIIRLRRAVGRYSVGRIVNPDGAVADARRHRQRLGQGDDGGQPPGRAPGALVVQEPGGVALPINADIPSDIDLASIDEVDEHASPIGGKGIDELGATGVDAAVATRSATSRAGASASSRPPPTSLSSSSLDGDAVLGPNDTRPIMQRQETS
jgi:xanthine dehydrogenase YagR molybdenum-binding subunit